MPEADPSKVRKLAGIAPPETKGRQQDGQKESGFRSRKSFMRTSQAITTTPPTTGQVSLWFAECGDKKNKRKASPLAKVYHGLSGAL